MIKINYSLAFISVLLVLLSANVTNAQHFERKLITSSNDSFRLRVSGTLQPMLTYANDNFSNTRKEHLAMGIRRSRLMMHFEANSWMRVFIQYEASNADSRVSLLDMRIALRLHKANWIRFGRFIGTQPYSFGHTIHNVLDGVNRTVIAEDWAKLTLGADGRDYGIEWQHAKPNFEFRVFVHNGYNQDNFRSAISSSSIAGNTNNTAIAIGSFIHYKFKKWKGWEIGGHVDRNNNRNQNTKYNGEGRRYTDYSAHLYYGSLPGSQPFRLKLDFIGIDYQEKFGFRQRFRGGSALVAIRPKSFLEFFQRAEIITHYRSDLLFLGIDDTSYITETGFILSIADLHGQAFNRNKLILNFANKLSKSPQLGNSYGIQAMYQLSF